MSRWHVRIDNQGRIDQADIARQLERKADQKVSQFTTGCIISIVMAVMVVFILVAVGGYIAWQVHKSGGVAAMGPGAAESPASGPAGSPAKASWDGKSTFECTGNDNKLIEGVTANVKDGSAISAMGNCHLTLKNVNVTGKTAIEAAGNAQVTISGGSINGSDEAIDAAGNAKVNVDATTKVTGKVEKGGNAQVTGVATKS